MNTQKIDITNQELMDVVAHGKENFPIQYFVDELFQYSQQLIPMHWHADIEFYTALGADVKIQIGQTEVILKEGNSIFINANILHSFRQLQPEHRCQCPNIVFNSELIAPTKSIIYKRYVQPIINNHEIPYIIFSPYTSWHREILDNLDRIFSLLQKYGETPQYYGKFPVISFKNKSIESSCFELETQFYLSHIWQIIFSHINEIAKIPVVQTDLKCQTRTQIMIDFIQENYQYPLTLSDIANAAYVGKSEAHRCFKAYLNDSPVKYLTIYRLERAKEQLINSNQRISEIAENCGFQSTSYFSKIFRKYTGFSATDFRKLYQ